MEILSCSDYGFECKFEARGNLNTVISRFKKHTESKHGINYSNEALRQVILRKKEKE